MTITDIFVGLVKLQLFGNLGGKFKNIGNLIIIQSSYVGTSLPKKAL
jgi:hypothetical protein